MRFLNTSIPVFSLSSKSLIAGSNPKVRKTLIQTEFGLAWAPSFLKRDKAKGTWAAKRLRLRDELTGQYRFWGEMSMKNKLSVLLVSTLGASALTCAFADSGRELLFSAPIQKLDQTIGNVTVLSQTFHSTADQLSIGQVVHVYGVLDKDGSVAKAIVEPTSSYGANGDRVFVKGVVTNTDSILGRVEVDGMSIDYTSQLANPDFIPPNVGDVIAIAASEPAQKGTLVALATGSDAYSAGISNGSSTQIAGGVAAVSAFGMAGTPVARMTGGGAGTAGMTGGGAGTAGMTGGGAGTAGMTGGGRGTAGMTGGGAGTAGMTGGGAGTAGMTG